MASQTSKPTLFHSHCKTIVLDIERDSLCNIALEKTCKLDVLPSRTASNASHQPYFQNTHDRQHKFADDFHIMMMSMVQRHVVFEAYYSIGRKLDVINLQHKITQQT